MARAASAAQAQQAASAQTGAYLSDFLGPLQPTDPWSFSTPVNGVQGPNGRIYVSDQIEDAVYEFQASGAYVGVFADSSDGLDSIRGIDFWARICT